MANKLKLLLGLLIVFTIAGCSSEEAEKPAVEVKKESEPVKAEAEPEVEESTIDTAVFQYAKNVKVTDARDITQHIDLVVEMDEGQGAGLATQHVITQTYDFLQQKDIEGAKTVTVGIMQGDLRISQFTVDTSKFVAGENFITSVVEASKMDKMNSVVKEYGKSANLW